MMRQSHRVGQHSPPHLQPYGQIRTPSRHDVRVTVRESKRERDFSGAHSVITQTTLTQQEVCCRKKSELPLSVCLSVIHHRLCNNHPTLPQSDITNRSCVFELWKKHECQQSCLFRRAWRQMCSDRKTGRKTGNKGIIFTAQGKHTALWLWQLWSVL